MDFVAVAIVSAIVLGHPVQQKSRILIGLNYILLCLNNSSQIAKKRKQNMDLFYLDPPPTKFLYQ